MKKTEFSLILAILSLLPRQVLAEVKDNTLLKKIDVIKLTVAQTFEVKGTVFFQDGKMYPKWEPLSTTYYCAIDAAQYEGKAVLKPGSTTFLYKEEAYEPLSELWRWHHLTNSEHSKDIQGLYCSCAEKLKPCPTLTTLKKAFGPMIKVEVIRRSEAQRQYPKGTFDPEQTGPKDAPTKNSNGEVVPQKKTGSETD